MNHVISDTVWIWYDTRFLDERTLSYARANGISRSFIKVNPVTDVG